MSNIAIRVENLSKLYRIGSGRPRYKTIRETLTGALSGSFRHLRGSYEFEIGDSRFEHVWALKDVSFEIKQGEVIGVIGRNGAGKSTLLKILSRITKPTEGRAEIHGRVGSLLEVGTGFHPELTGRENIYLNGAILGMRKAEIERRFDEIVAFAEVEKFIDTPVKHYSSGMYVRLAFAVAAHLEPEILLVDEVLAVGDAAFQKKCMGKMGDVAKGGRTVIFVSHQLNQIRRLSGRCVWLHGGQVRTTGLTVEVVSAYEAAMSELAVPHDSVGRGRADHTRFLRWGVEAPTSEQPHRLAGTSPCTVKFVVHIARPVEDGQHGVALWNSEGQIMWAAAADRLRLPAGNHEFVHTLPGLPLRPGVYRWQVSLYADRELLDNWYAVPDLIIATESYGHPRDEWAGILNLASEFRVRPAG